MAAPRKRRTREHVIADMSRVHVESVVIDAGFAAEVFRSDYGYDLLVTTFDDGGYVEPGRVLLQLKASDKIPGSGSAPAFPHDLDVRDYRLWTQEPSPVFLVLFSPKVRRAYWLYVQRYFEEEPSRRPGRRAKTVRVWVPAGNLVDVGFMAVVRAEKARILSQAKGTIRHA